MGQTRSRAPSYLWLTNNAPLSRRDGSLRPDEGEQSCVDLILMRSGDAVRRAGIVNVLRTFDQLGRLPRGVLHRNDLVVLAVKYQCRYIELLQVLGKVGFGEGFDTLVGVLEAALHAPEPKLIQHSLRNLRVGPVGAVERDCELLVVLGPIPGEGRTPLVEQLDRETLGIGIAL